MMEKVKAKNKVKPVVGSELFDLDLTVLRS